MKKLTIVTLTLTTLLIALLTTSVSAQPDTGYWKALGGPVGGSTNDITIDSLNRIYVCTGGDGVMQSTDGGLHWQGFNQGLRVLPFLQLESSTIENGVNTVAYVYGQSQRGEMMRRLFNKGRSDTHWEYLSNIGRGILKRIDTIIKVTGLPPDTVSHLDTTWASTLTVNQILTNRKGYVYLATTSFGVLRSRDHGDHFDQYDLHDANEEFISVAQPDTNVHLIAINRTNQNLFAISDSNGVHNSSTAIMHLSYSTDDGTSWSRLPSMPPPDADHIQSLLIADDGSILIGVYVQFCDQTTGLPCDSERVWRSSDMGKSWQGVLSIPPARESNADALFHARNGSDIYCNLHGPMFRSTDNGATWTIRNPEKAGEETFHCAVDTLNRIFQCSIPDAVRRFDDSGLTMIDMTPNLSVQHMDGGLVVDSKSRVFAMSQFNMYRLDPDSLPSHWYNFPFELDEPNFPFFTLDHEDRLYYGFYYGMFRQHDYTDSSFDTIIHCHSELRYSTHPLDASNQIYYHGVNAKDELFVSSEKDPTGNISSDGFWFLKSTNQGDTWTRLNVGGQYGMGTNEQITAFDFPPTQSSVYDTIYATSNTSSFLYRSTNDGINWSKVSREMNGVIQILCHPDGSVFRLQFDGLFRSVDGGATWDTVFPPPGLVIPNYSQVKPLLLDRLGRVMICTYDYAPGGTEPDSNAHTGFFLSQNADFTQWKNVSKGFIGDDWFTDRYLNCSQVSQDKKTGLYYANSRGRGVFVSTTPDLDSEASTNGVVRNLTPALPEPKNYPNPFERTTQISFDVQHSGNVKVAVYDVLGRLVEVIASGYMESGSHTLPFDASIVAASGQYMLKIQSGSDVTSHWMTVTK